MKVKERKSFLFLHVKKLQVGLIGLELDLLLCSGSVTSSSTVPTKHCRL